MAFNPRDIGADVVSQNRVMGSMYAVLFDIFVNLVLMVNILSFTAAFFSFSFLFLFFFFSFSFLFLFFFFSFLFLFFFFSFLFSIFYFVFSILCFLFLFLFLFLLWMIIDLNHQFRLLENFCLIVLLKDLIDCYNDNWF